MTFFLAVAIVIAAASAFTDWRTGHIPNFITYGAFAISPFAHVLFVLVQHGTKTEALLAGAYSILGAVVCAVLPAIFYRLSAIGGGDVKLFIALGALLHPWIGGEVQIWSFLAAGLLAPIQLAYQGKLFKTVSNAAAIAINPFLGKEKRRELSPDEMSWFRMGPAILVATVYVAISHWRMG